MLKAEFGALLETAFVVAHGRDPAHVVGVDAVQLAGKAGEATPSKFCAQGDAARATLIPIPATFWSPPPVNTVTPQRDEASLYCLLRSGAAP